MLVTGIIAVLVVSLELVVYQSQKNLSKDEQAEVDAKERIRVLRIVDEELKLKRRISENQIWFAQMKAKMKPATNPLPLIPPKPIDPNE